MRKILLTIFLALLLAGPVQAQVSSGGVSISGVARIWMATKTETLSGNKTLTVVDEQYQKLDADGSDRDVTLPPEAISGGLPFWILNDSDGAGETLTIKNDTPATLGTLEPGEMGMFVCNGTEWVGGKMYPDGGPLVVDGVANTVDIAGDLTSTDYDGIIGSNTPAAGTFTDLAVDSISSDAGLLPVLILDSTRTTGTATSVLAGTIDVSASTSVVGSGTAFTTELTVGDRLSILDGTEIRTVTVITDATNLTVDAAFTNLGNDTSPDKLWAIAILRNAAGTPTLTVNDLGTVTIATTNATGLKFDNLGTATEGIDFSGSGLTVGDHWIHGDASYFWDADGDIRLNQLYVGGSQVTLSSGSGRTVLKAQHVGGDDLILLANSESSVLIGTDQPISISNTKNSGNTVIAKAAHGKSIAVGNLVHVTDSSESADKGFYTLKSLGTSVTHADISFTATPDEIVDGDSQFGSYIVGEIVTVTGTSLNNTDYTITGVAAGALTVTPTPTAEGSGASVTVDSTPNSIIVDRSLTGSGDGDVDLTIYKNVIGFFATDGVNGQRIMNYSHQDRPLQIGGDVLAATGHVLGTEGVLIGGDLEVDGRSFFDGIVDFNGSGGTAIKGGYFKINNALRFSFGTGSDVSFIWQAGSADFLKLALKVNNADYSGNFVIAGDFLTQDFDLPAATNPTVAIFSALDPDTSNNQWGSFSHDQEDFVITTGANTGDGTEATTDENGVKIFPRGGSAGLHVMGLGELHATRSAITVGSGTGITVNVTGDINHQVYKVTTTYTAYSDSDTTKGIVIATLPAKMKIVVFYADTTTPYTGGAVSATTLEVGITAESAGEIIASHDVRTGAVTKGLADGDMGTSMTRVVAIQGGYLPSWTGTTAIYATIDTTTANTNALTAGSTTFYITTEQY